MECCIGVRREGGEGGAGADEILCPHQPAGSCGRQLHVDDDQVAVLVHGALLDDVKAVALEQRCVQQKCSIQI